MSGFGGRALGVRVGAYMPCALLCKARVPGPVPPPTPPPTGAAASSSSGSGPPPPPPAGPVERVKADVVFFVDCGPGKKPGKIT
eukprot:4128263-Pyramimonas_sp.AAC.1